MATVPLQSRLLNADQTSSTVKLTTMTTYSKNDYVRRQQSTQFRSLCVDPSLCLEPSRHWASTGSARTEFRTSVGRINRMYIFFGPDLGVLPLQPASQIRGVTRQPRHHPPVCRRSNVCSQKIQDTYSGQSGKSRGQDTRGAGHRTRFRPGFSVESAVLLNYSQFELTLEILGEWRVDRHCSSKGRLQDTSFQASELAGG